MPKDRLSSSKDFTKNMTSPRNKNTTGQKNGIPRTGKNRAEEFRMPKERLSSSKEFTKNFFVAKGSSDLKWQRTKMVIGALEVKSEPMFQPKEDMKPLYRSNDEDATKSKFEDALQLWQDLKLRNSFIKACRGLPDSVCCCGLSLSDSSSTIKQYVTLLNDGWVKHANKKLKTSGFKIDIFHWNWHNTSGKSETNVLLIRFFELSTYKFQRASAAGSLDLDDMLLEKEDKKSGDRDDSSH